MLITALVFIFFVLLAIAYELHGIADRLIETGTIVEHYNRRDLRKSAILKDEDDDVDGDYVVKVHRTWRQILSGIVLASLFTIAVIKWATWK
jgi:hypothetical protein